MRIKVVCQLATVLLMCGAVWLTSACALRSPAPSASQVADGSAPGAMRSIDLNAQNVPEQESVAARQVSRVEDRDKDLAGALQRVVLAPTGENHRRVAERYRQLRIPDMALDHYSRAAATDSEDAAAQDGMARIWRDWGFPDRALGYAYRAVFHAPASAVVHNTLGTVFQALGDQTAARQAFQRAAEIEPTAVYALSNLCYLSFLQGQLDRAAEICRSALAIDRTYQPARHNLALTHAAAGRLELARKEFMDGDDVALGYFNMGIVHLAQRNYTSAAAAFNAASRANPLMKVAREHAHRARRLERAGKRTQGGDHR